jgi:hypothetical protein
MANADKISALITQGIVASAQVLTPDQRKLAGEELAKGRGHHRWGPPSSNGRARLRARAAVRSVRSVSEASTHRSRCSHDVDRPHLEDEAQLAERLGQRRLAPLEERQDVTAVEPQQRGGGAGVPRVMTASIMTLAARCFRGRAASVLTIMPTDANAERPARNE